MALSRWHDSDWYIWSQHDKDTKKEVLMVWNIAEQTEKPQKFHRQEVRKMLNGHNYARIRHFDPSVVPHLQRWLQE